MRSVGHVRSLAHLPYLIDYRTEDSTSWMIITVIKPQWFELAFGPPSPTTTYPFHPHRTTLVVGKVDSQPRTTKTVAVCKSTSENIHLQNETERLPHLGRMVAIRFQLGCCKNVFLGYKIRKQISKGGHLCFTPVDVCTCKVNSCSSLEPKGCQHQEALFRHKRTMSHLPL